MVTAHDLLAAVEARSETESGALVVHAPDGPVGCIFAEHGRVCWAAAARQGRRLRDLIRRYSTKPIPAADFERIVLACRAEGRPFGETLVDLGLCSAEAMRDALHQHTIDSLIDLCASAAGDVSWVHHRRRGYRAAFTMTPLELLASVCAHDADSEELEAATIGLADVAPPDAVGVSLVVRAGRASVVHAQRTERLDVRAVDAMGEWAIAAFEASAGFGPGIVARIVECAEEPVAIAWRSSRHVLHVAITEGRAPLEALVATLARRGLAAVLSQHTAPMLARRWTAGPIGTEPTTPA